MFSNKSTKDMTALPAIAQAGTSRQKTKKRTLQLKSIYETLKN